MKTSQLGNSLDYHLHGISLARQRFKELGDRHELPDTREEMMESAKHYIEDKKQRALKMATPDGETIQKSDFLNTTRGIAGVSWLMTYATSWFRKRVVELPGEEHPDLEQLLFQEIQELRN